VIAVKETKVRDVMTASVVAVRESADFKEMVTAMRSRRISAFPVLDAQDRVIGVVSEADLLLKEATLPMPQGIIRLAWRLRERAKADGATDAVPSGEAAASGGRGRPAARHRQPVGPAERLRAAGCRDPR
jgi:hypothetical protein